MLAPLSSTGFLLLSHLGSVLHANANPILAHSAQVKRSANDLHESYDYIIVGGGTSGLVVANRLSEDPAKTVLVVELGYFGDGPCIWMPINFGPGRPRCSAYSFNETTVPQPGINNASMLYTVGAVVGGSSAVNGMFFDRGSKADYNAWEALGNPGWGWDGLFKYFKKSTKFTAPSSEGAKEFGYTWDESAYGEGPIQASLSRFQWGSTKIMWNAWDDLNITGPKEHALGDAIGRFWVPASQHPVNQTRSYARYGYYDPIKERANYHLLIGHKVEKVQLSPNLGVEGVLIHPRDQPGEKFTAKATKEVVLAAGAVHTPQILELSGIGPKAVLETADLQVKVDLPGVGNNFQDHPQASYSCTFTNDVWPNPSTLTTNTTYASAALAEYNANRTGPYTLALGNSAVFLPLRTTHSSPDTFLSKLTAQAPDAYLLPNLPSEVVAGYAAQKEILHSLYDSKSAAAYETPFSGGCGRTLILQKPLSRGSIHINTSDPSGPPLIDFRVYSNPLDIEQAIEFIKYTRTYIKAPTLQPLGPVEIGPGSNVSSGDTAGLEKWVHRTSGPTSFHASGTAAMMPRELGGVVGSDLKVYGVGENGGGGLSIVDASVFPLIPSTHLSATVYAVAEKAADIIKERA